MAIFRFKYPRVSLEVEELNDEEGNDDSQLHRY